MVAFLLLLGTLTSSAQTSRANEPNCEQDGASKVAITDADATILGLAIGRSSLKDVQAKLGSAKTLRVSREEESDIAVCYISPADGTVLIFYSGSMGGWKDITWFALWSREAAYPHAARCTPSTKVSQKLATQSGLQIGMTSEQVKKLAGTPTSLKASSAKYDYLCRRKMTDEEIKGFKTANGWDVRSDPYFDQMSWIEVHLIKAKIARIEVGKIESY